jgi:uncharacterized membrane protein HdeD (DUF308 family)
LEVLRLRNHTPPTSDEVRSVIKRLLAQQLWKTELGRQLWTWQLVSGVLTVILGGIVLAWPGPSILVASTLFGVYMLLTGFVQLLLAFALPRSAATRVLLFIGGALSLVLAVLSLRHFGDAYAVLLLSVWIGIGVIFRGVADIAAVTSERDLPARGWYVVLGVIAVMAGAVMLVWPFASIVVLAIVFGVWLVLYGVMQIVQSIEIRKDAGEARQIMEAMAERLAALQHRRPVWALGET